MTPDQRRRLDLIRCQLSGLIADVRASRDAAPVGAKAPFRYPLDFLENADTEMDCAQRKRGGYDA